MRCDCGCELGHHEDVGDDVTDFLIEEASMISYEAHAAAAMDEETPEPKPGEITDPVMQDAMAKAKQLHAERFGTRV